MSGQMGGCGSCGSLRSEAALLWCIRAEFPSPRRRRKPSHPASPKLIPAPSFLAVALCCPLLCLRDQDAGGGVGEVRGAAWPSCSSLPLSKRLGLPPSRAFVPVPCQSPSLPPSRRLQVTKASPCPPNLMRKPRQSQSPLQGGGITVTRKQVRKRDP